MSSELPDSNYLKSFVVGKGSKQREIDVDEIDWIESSDHYLILHNHYERHMIYGTMKNLENSLDPEKFIRVHRCFIVRIKAIESYEKDKLGDIYLFLTDSNKIKVSRHKNDVIDRLIRKITLKNKI